MNPYDFVRTDWNNPPARQAPKPHHKFDKDTCSGRIECQLTAETLIFIPLSDAEQEAKQKFAAHRNEYGMAEDGAYYIPGSSLKGLFRSLVEVMGNGCYSKFDGKYKQAYYVNKVPSVFQQCNSPKELCIGCRLFGFIGRSEKDDDKLHSKITVHKGQVQISDAEFIAGEEYGKFILHSIGGPNPRHDAFYLTADKQTIAGRKFYFHSLNPLSGREGDFNAPVIYPLKPGAVFTFTIHFDNLTQSELNTLLYAIVLEENMRHKIGYAKPLGLGSVKIEITELMLLRRHLRYANHPDSKQTYQADQLEQYLIPNLASFRSNQSNTFKDLWRIWAWPPPQGVRYEYPTYEWFKEAENSQLRLHQIP